MIRPTKNIKVKIKLTGSITGKLNGSTIVVEPELENLEVTPSTEEQVFKSKKYGFDEVRVNGITAEIDEDIKPENIKAGVNILGVNGSYEGVDTSDATATPNDILVGKTAYSNNEKIEGTMQEYDGSYSGNVSESEEEFKITNCAYLFYKGARTNQLNEVLKHCKDFENANYIFAECNSILSEDIDFTLLDFSKVTTIQYGFDKCSKLETIDLSHFNNNTIKYFLYAFRNCTALKNLNLNGFKMDQTININSMFSSATNLTELRGFKNLGKGYVEKRNNYSAYTLNLSGSTNLTRESLIDVINNLYDLNLTYDVANGGTLYRQTLDLGATNLAKLTEEEIAIATNKGWDIS